MVEVLSGVPKVTVCMVMAILSVEEIPPIFCRARDPCRAKIASFFAPPLQDGICNIFCAAPVP